MRDLPRLCLIIKHPKGYLVQKQLDKVGLVKLTYDPYSDDIDGIIFGFLYKATGAEKIDITDLGIYNFKDERIRIMAVKIKEIKPLLSNCSICVLPEGLKLLNYKEMDYLASSTEKIEDFVAWKKYTETLNTLQTKLDKLK